MLEASSANWPAFARPLDHGIVTIDTGFHRPNFDAAYLIVERGRAAFVDTGVNASVPRLLATLAAAGLAPDAVDYVIATHVHLDHAGGAGLLLSKLPTAKLVVHANGAPHLIAPDRLLASARSVYGAAAVRETYGDIVGVPAQRVLRTADNTTISLAGRPLALLDTPGHARHHHCIWDERSRGYFTGDTFGISYREFDTAQGPWILPSTTPIEFEPDALRTSIRRLVERRPATMYLTHYGPVGDVPRLAEQLVGLLDETVALAEALPPKSDRHATLTDGLADMYTRSLRVHGCTLDASRIRELLSMDIELNAQGIDVWLARRRRGARAA